MQKFISIVGNTISLVDYFLEKGNKSKEILAMLKTDNVVEAIKYANAANIYNRRSML